MHPLSLPLQPKEITFLVSGLSALTNYSCRESSSLEGLCCYVIKAAAWEPSGVSRPPGPEQGWAPSIPAEPGKWDKGVGEEGGGCHQDI